MLMMRISEYYNNLRHSHQSDIQEDKHSRIRVNGSSKLSNQSKHVEQYS